MILCIYLTALSNCYWARSMIAVIALGLLTCSAEGEYHCSTELQTV
jgi:hypothetical protein